MLISVANIACKMTSNVVCCTIFFNLFFLGEGGQLRNHPVHNFQRCPSMMPLKDALQWCPSRMPLKDAPQRYPSKMILKDAPQRSPSKMPLKDASQRCPSIMPLNDAFQKCPSLSASVDSNALAIKEVRITFPYQDIVKLAEKAHLAVDDQLSILGLDLPLVQAVGWIITPCSQRKPRGG